MVADNIRSVPALFCYELLEDKTLQHRETIQLAGNPLDVEVIEPSSGAAATPRLVVAIDPSASSSSSAEGSSSSSSLVVLDKGESGWRQSKVENLPACSDIKISATELQKILYSTESLRKSSDFD